MSFEPFLSKGFEEMSKIGIFGVFCFWSRLLLIFVPVVNACFAFYLLSIYVNRIWIRALGGNLAAVSVFIAVFCIASSVFLILTHLGIKFGPIDNFVFLLACLLSAGGIITEASFLSQITDAKTELYVMDLRDFCIRFNNDAEVMEFLISHNSVYRLSTFVQERTSDMYAAAASFLSIWVILFAVFSLTLYLLSKPQNNSNFNNDGSPDTGHLKALTT